MRRTRKVLFVFLVALTHICVFAQNEPGLSGFIQVSGAYLNFKTNTVAGFLRSGISEGTTPSLFEKPPSQQVFTSMAASEIKYTFKGRKWQLYFGGSLLDIVRLELIQQLAVRMFIGEKGYVGLGILGTGVPISVWTDPYVVGIEREATVRNSLGFRFEWTYIAQTNLGIQYDFRTNAITEQSGEFLGLSETERNLLDRNGFDQRIRVNYIKKISEGHSLLPDVTYKHFNANGAAKKGHGIGVGLTYSYKKSRFTSAANIAFGYRRYAAENPVYQIKQQNREFSVTENVFYRVNNNPRAALIVTGSVSYVLSDSNIDFHSQNGLLLSIGILFKYGPILRPKGYRENGRE